MQPSIFCNLIYCCTFVYNLCNAEIIVIAVRGRNVDFFLNQEADDDIFRKELKTCLVVRMGTIVLCSRELIILHNILNWNDLKWLQNKDNILLNVCDVQSFSFYCEGISFKSPIALYLLLIAATTPYQYSDSSITLHFLRHPFITSAS